MIRLYGPYNSPETLVVLPNPELSDTEATEGEVSYGQSLNSTSYTYVRKSGMQRLSYTFAKVLRVKMHELLEFMIAYAHQDVRLEDYEGQMWRVKILSPISVVTQQKASGSVANSSEAGDFSLEFVGVKV